MGITAVDSARTFVLVEDGHIAGYFSLTMGAVRRAEPPRALVLPGYPVGMVLLARLAVDTDHLAVELEACCLPKHSVGLWPLGRRRPLAWSSWTLSTTRPRASTPHHGFIATVPKSVSSVTFDEDGLRSHSFAGWR